MQRGLHNLNTTNTTQSENRTGCIRESQYLHVPKAGSAFAPYIWAAACASLPKDVLILRHKPSKPASTDFRWILDWSQECPCIASAYTDYHHVSLGVNATAKRVAQASGLFRAPLDRDISHWNYFRRDQGRTNDKERQGHILSLLQNLSGMNDKGLQLPPPKPPLNTSEYFQMVASLASQSHQHIQSRIIFDFSGEAVQRMFAEPYPTHQTLRILIDRVWRMGFVGLTECFEESVELFVTKFKLDRGRLPLQSQHKLARANAPIVSAAAAVLVHAQAESLRQLGWTDPYDEAVYEAARTRFHQERRAYDVPLMSERCNATASPAAKSSLTERAHQPWLQLVKLVNANASSDYDDAVWAKIQDF